MSAKDLSPQEAARLFENGVSACWIADRYGTTRKVVEGKIRQGGLGGVVYCPDCRKYETVTL